MLAALTGCTALALGAVSAHMVADSAAAALVEKASFYQLVHALLLWNLSRRQEWLLKIARWLLLAGILLFCGSFYAKALLMLEHAPLAPLGGSCLMLGWLVMAVGAWRNSAG